jgi:hypothetical protein
VKGIVGLLSSQRVAYDLYELHIIKSIVKRIFKVIWLSDSRIL